MITNNRTFRHRPPRLERIFTPLDPFYFVTFNTFVRRPILAHQPVHEAFISFVSKAQEFNVAVGRYVIMPDHVHLFVMMPKEGITLSEWMKSLKSVLGFKLKAAGWDKPWWQDGFFDHLLRSDESYAEKWEYVRMNPVRAGLCERPEDWPYQGEIVPIQF